MAKKRKKTEQHRGSTHSYRHAAETRKNNPSVGLGPDNDIAETAPTRYAYNPHLQPVLQFESRFPPRPTPVKYSKRTSTHRCRGPAAR